MPAGTDGCDPPGVTTRLLATIETYYDAAPRPGATTEEVGPFSLFVRTDPGGRHYYARPRLGDTARVTPADVDSVRSRQRELAVPESLEWVHETTPSLRGTTTELTGIAVLPRARRRGVGAALAAALVADAVARGVQTVFLSAQDDEVARVSERVGFVRVGTACIAEPA
jgi:ribosomal protein S18 acetylase RimI-like enzyme